MNNPTLGEQVVRHVNTIFTKPLYFFCFFITACSAFASVFETDSPFVRIQDILTKFVNDPKNDEPKFVKNLAKLLLRPIPALINHERVFDIFLGPLPTVFNVYTLQVVLSYVMVTVSLLFSNFTILSIFIVSQIYNMMLESSNIFLSLILFSLVVVFFILGWDETIILFTKVSS